MMTHHRIFLLIGFAAGVVLADVGDIDQEFKDIDSAGTPSLGAAVPKPGRNAPEKNPDGPTGVKQTCMIALTRLEAEADALDRSLDRVRELLFVGKDHTDATLQTLRRLRRLVARSDSRSEVLAALIRRAEECRPAQRKLAAYTAGLDEYKALALQVHAAAVSGDRTGLDHWRQALTSLERDRDSAVQASASLAVVDAEIQDVVKLVHSDAWGDATRKLIEEMREQHMIVQKQLLGTDRIRREITRLVRQIERAREAIAKSIVRHTQKCPSIAGAFGAIKTRTAKLALTRVDRGMRDYMDAFQEGLDVPDPDKMERSMHRLLGQVRKNPVAGNQVGDELRALYAIAAAAIDKLAALPAAPPAAVVAVAGAPAVEPAVDASETPSAAEPISEAPLAAALLDKRDLAAPVPAEQTAARVDTARAAPSVSEPEIMRPAPPVVDTAAQAAPPIEATPVRIDTTSDPVPAAVLAVVPADPPAAAPRPSLEVPRAPQEAPVVAATVKRQESIPDCPPIVVAVVIPAPARDPDPVDKEPPPVASAPSTTTPAASADEPGGTERDSAITDAAAGKQKLIRRYERWIARSQKRIECLEAGIREHGKSAKRDCRGHRIVRSADHEIEDQRYWIGVYGQQIRMLQRDRHAGS